jgi:mono/diheme cytochrome c family protein
VTNRILRWSAIAVASLLGLAVLVCALVYGLSEYKLRQTHEVAAVALILPTDAESIAEGRRLATIRGCFHGCHGKEAEGYVMFDDPKIARVVAPNLTAAVRKYSDAQLAAIVRNGVYPDGRSTIIMPAATFHDMTDVDLARILAFLKTLPPVPGPGPEVSVGPLGRIGLATGKLKTVTQEIVDTVPPPPGATPEAEIGRYLARTVCAECHGTSLRGASNPSLTSPDLGVVAAYPPEAFTRLMREGIALGDRELGLMSSRSRVGFQLLTDTEIAALYGYLRTLPEVAPN